MKLRRVCFTKDKREWIKDFVEGLGSGCVFFYNFIKTGDELEAIMQKALPKGAKVWRIDGKHHEIPTAETVCTVFGRDEQECKDGIDDVLDMTDNVTQNNTNVKGE